MPADLETRIQARGRQLYGLIEDETPSVFKKDFWTGKVMDWCMNDEAFKVEMFRFVDVFPTLNRPESVARHLREYFCRPGQEFPEALQWGIKSLPPDSFAAKLVAKGISKNIAAMGGQFILGANPAEALPEIEKMRGNGLAFTADLLGEVVVSEGEAGVYQRRNIELLDVLQERQKGWPTLGGGGGDLDWGHAPKINVSVKTSALYSQLKARAFEHSVERAKGRLREIVRRAMKIGAFINLDMENRALKNLTLGLYRSLMEEDEFAGYPHTGIAMQAYLRETEDDLRELIDWSKDRRQPLVVRLVKGAYWDAEQIWAKQNNWPVPVFTNKHEMDANFEGLARLILQNHETVQLACASHSIRSVAFVIEAANELGIPGNEVECQILYGMAEPVRNALKKAGIPVRLYSPIGEMVPGMAYLVRRLLENTANESFLRQSFLQGVDRDLLLKDPRLLAPNGRGPREARAEPEAAGGDGFHNLPPIDWTSAEARARFAESLGKLRSRFPLKVPLLIGGERVTSGAKIASTNPNRPEEVVGVVSSANGDLARRAIEAARAAFPAWRDTPAERRAEYLFRAAEAGRKRRGELTALQVFEVGKAWNEADAEVCEAIDFLEYYGHEMVRLSNPRRMGRAPGEASQLFYEPRGVAAVIAPWNFPMAISIGMSSAAVVTGNTVVYKPASESPVIGWMIAELFEEAGLPKGVFNYLPGPGAEIGDLLVTHPDVALIAFTGSMEVGLRINRLACEIPEGAMHVKRVVAEMGGKNAIIVDEDADLDEAIGEILHSAFGFQGQKCSACSRLIVVDAIYERLIERLRAAAESLELGPAEDPASYMGAVVSASAKRKIEEYIEIGGKEGRLLVSRLPEKPGGHVVPLTIFTGIRPEHRIAQEEIFGPVLGIIRTKDFSEALAVANGTRYALTGGVCSRSPENIERAKREFRVGNLYINRGCTGAIVERHPFGGFKMSGVGSKAGGPDYLQQFMVPRSIVENTMRRGFAPSEG